MTNYTGQVIKWME